MLKTIEQKLRDKERQEIIRADQETARSLQRFVKKARANDNEILQERQTMTQYAQYSLENKYLNFEKAIKQAYNMVDNNLEFDGFVNVITAYNELINYIVSIAKYNSLSQSLRVPIDERMNKLNGFLRNLIDVSYATKKYRLTSLEDMYDNIRNKIYKLVDIDINFTKFTADDAKKTELNSKLDLGIKIMRETANTFKKLNKKSTQEIDIQTWMKELKAFQKEQLNLSNKKDQDKLKKMEAKIETIVNSFMGKYKPYVRVPDIAVELLQEAQAQPQLQAHPTASINYPVALSTKSKRAQIPLEAREEKFMQDPEKADVPAGQVLAPILAPEVVQNLEDAQDKFNQFFPKQSAPVEEPAKEKLNTGVFKNEPEDALLGEEPAQKKKRGRPKTKIIKDVKPHKLGEDPKPEFKEVDIDPEQKFFEPEPEPEISEGNKRLMEDFFNKTPLTGNFREKFIKLLAKRIEARSGMSREESIKQVREDARKGNIILDDSFSRLYLNDDEDVVELATQKQTGFKTKVFLRLPYKEMGESITFDDKYPNQHTHKTVVKLLADELIKNNPKRFKDYDAVSKLKEAESVIKNGIEDGRIVESEQKYRLYKQNNSTLVKLIKKLDKEFYNK